MTLQEAEKKKEEILNEWAEESRKVFESLPRRGGLAASPKELEPVRDKYMKKIRELAAQIDDWEAENLPDQGHHDSTS